ncbi:MAG: APC family permease, partial [Candidatus Thorarchaeota archaeon]
EEIQEPEKNIPRSIFATIIIATVIYILVSFTALGGTNYHQFADNPEAAEYALAIAAEPVLGKAGFIIITIGALFSTASAFNASLYGSSRLSFVMARETIFPNFFQKLSKKNRVPIASIIVISAITAVMTLVLPLQQIAELASTIFLLLFATVSLSSLILRKETKANFILPLLGFLMSSSIFGVFIWYLIKQIIEEGKGYATIIILPIVIVFSIMGSIITIKIQNKKKSTV